MALLSPLFPDDAKINDGLNRLFHVLHRHPLVLGMEGVFASDWYIETGEDLPVTPTTPVHNADIAVFVAEIVELRVQRHSQPLRTASRLSGSTGLER